MKTIEIEAILIEKDVYKYLRKREEWLCCLEMLGVDNWNGYDTAVELWKKVQGDEPFQVKN